MTLRDIMVRKTTQCLALLGAAATLSACAVVVPPGSCQPSSSLSALVSGTNVVAYVAKGDWLGGATGVSAVNVEGTSITNTLIATPNLVNSCASNGNPSSPGFGKTVCTANNTDVYLISGTTLNTTLASGGSGTILFPEPCTNCGVTMDGVNNKALISLSIAGAGGFQFLDLSTSTFATAFASPAPATPFGPPNISEGPLIDPIQSTPPLPGGITLPLLLSASGENNYEIVGNAESASASFFEKPIPNSDTAGSSGADCSTGIALAPYEESSPSQVFIADLTQATFTPGTPGSWTTPATASQVQTLGDSSLNGGASGIAVAPGTHTGIVTGEFSITLTAIALPMTSGSGTPAIGDWVTCSIGGGFSTGGDPNTVTAYQSPNGAKDAIALLSNGATILAGPTMLAKVDLTQMLNTTTVPRTAGTHACSAGVLPATVVTFISVTP